MIKLDYTLAHVLILTAINSFNRLIILLIAAKLVNVGVRRFYKRLLGSCVFRHYNNNPQRKTYLTLNFRSARNFDRLDTSATIILSAATARLSNVLSYQTYLKI